MTTKANGFRAATLACLYPLEDKQMCFLFLKVLLKYKQTQTGGLCELQDAGPFPSLRGEGDTDFLLWDWLCKGFSDFQSK